MFLNALIEYLIFKNSYKLQKCLNNDVSLNAHPCLLLNKKTNLCRHIANSANIAQSSSSGSLPLFVGNLYNKFFHMVEVFHCARLKTDPIQLREAYWMIFLTKRFI